MENYLNLKYMFNVSTNKLFLITEGSYIQFHQAFNFQQFLIVFGY